MKTQFKNYALSLFLVLAIVIANFFVYYTSVCNPEILQSKDIYGKVRSVNLVSMQNRKQLILNLNIENLEDTFSILSVITIIYEILKQIQTFYPIFLFIKITANL